MPPKSRRRALAPRGGGQDAALDIDLAEIDLKGAAAALPLSLAAAGWRRRCCSAAATAAGRGAYGGYSGSHTLRALPPARCSG